MRAYVLVKARPREVRAVACQVVSFDGVKRAEVCGGVPDIFVVAEVAGADELNKLVIDKILSLAGVEGTETHIAAQQLAPWDAAEPANRR